MTPGHPAAPWLLRAHVPYVDDRFEVDRAPGTVIGSEATFGAVRRGVDVEGRLAVDHGALRIGCPREPGWGRHGVAYGPFPLRAGLAFSTLVLNGHNASQTNAIEGSPLGVAAAHLRRLGWRARGQVRAALEARARRWWPGLARRLGRPGRPPNHVRWPPIRESLAVGWFDRERVRRPAREGAAFVMRADGPACGELCVSVGGHLLPVLEGVQNVPLHLVVVARPAGVAYYVASLEGVPGTAAWPELRPVALDPAWEPRRAFAGIHQSILGEIRFAVDSRVSGVRVAEVSGWTRWWGGAHAADRLGGRGPLLGSAAEVGGGWDVVEGAFERSGGGLRAGVGRAAAWLRPEATSGLIHVWVAVREPGATAGLAWRGRSVSSYWALHLGREGARLVRVERGWETEVARDPAARLPRRGEASVQVSDDGERFWVALDGRRLFGGSFRDARLADGPGVGLLSSAGAAGVVTFRDLEVHPARVAVPEVLDVGAPWQPSSGEVAVAEEFEGAAGELDGKRTTSGGEVWTRVLGDGRIDLTGDGAARVRAAPARPNPGRTLYTIPWEDAGFADLEVEIVPPGARQGEGQLGRAGLVLWEDARNYIVLNDWNDDRFAGTSISSFFVLDGREDVYDAVWTNVGDRIQRGLPHSLRVVCDGLRYLVRLDGEPVLYRALTDVYPTARPLALRRVGLAVNWEFGDDTGSIFRRFRARGRG